ncbi:hypothetical protein ACGFNU_04340 [Spirillospora sp. NPDC048911]|uniref:hypothetical protein n=1 Tax=Spirillospora sp. NPDC048911 TaxID=3364527 RepID=UPI003712D29C
MRILLVPATAWLVWSLFEYLRAGSTLNYDDPHFFSSLTFATIVFLTLLALEILRPLDRPDSRRIRVRLGLVSAFTSLLCLASRWHRSWSMARGPSRARSAAW